MKLTTITLMGLLGFLLGCFTDEPYQKKSGAWYYKKVAMTVPAGAKVVQLSRNFATAGKVAYFRADVIEGADGESFHALSDHYAKDRARVYYCDDYRKGQEYWLIKRNRVAEVEGADAPTFAYLDFDYARDIKAFYYEGKSFSVADVASFELLNGAYQRDKVHGYYLREPIAGSDGKSFVAVNYDYARDANNVYYSRARVSTESGPATVVLKGAQSATFVELEEGYVQDAGHIYHSGKAISDASSPLQFLGYSYAKTAKSVFWLGDPVVGADAPTFTRLETPTDSVDATDATGSYLSGKKVKQKR